MADGARRDSQAAPRRYRRARGPAAPAAERGAAEGPESAEAPARPARARRVQGRSAADTRQEILDAAVFFLNRRPFRELTVPNLMSYTTVGRSAFYFQFKDIYAVVEALLSGLRERVLAYVGSWSAAEVAPAEGLKTFVADMVNIWVMDGPMIGAMLDAAAEDPRLEKIASDITGLFQKVVAEVLVQEHQAGRIDAMDFDEMAVALVLASQSYLKSRLGRPGARDPLRVMTTLQALWIRSIYGRAPG
ncbi:MAG: TetR/AcrR family transcriptional regulator [Pseudomonadota bacterium]